MGWVVVAPPGRLLRTVALLRPEQPVARARLRAQRAAAASTPRGTRLFLDLTSRSARATARRGGIRWPAGFVPFDARVARADAGAAGVSAAVAADAAERAAGRFTLLGTSRELGSPPDWAQPDAPTLWRFHLHYWDWAWSLALHPERSWARTAFGELFASWRTGTVIGRGDAWAPYVVSLRAWSWCGLFEPLADGTPHAALLAEELARHAAFLRRHLETDVGGNHLLKNIKALLGLAVAFGDHQAAEHWTDLLVRQIGLQVLPDGGHAERAPAYHCQVLADLDDLAGLLDADGAHVPGELTAARARMRAWLGEVLTPDGTVPLLNDGYPVPRAAVDALAHPPVQPRAEPGTTATCRVSESTEGSGLAVLPDSGLAVLRTGPWWLLADVGLPCPDDLPAHAHADTLSFLLWHDGIPLLVEQGTSTYDAGPVRTAQRSTAAHNTVTVDGHDSTEVWGAFRAGRRARVSLGPVTSDGPHGGPRLTATHDGYRWLSGSPRHTRIWELGASGLTVTDRISGSGRHRLDLRFHFATGYRLQLPGPVSGPGPVVAERAEGHSYRLGVSGTVHGTGVQPDGTADEVSGVWSAGTADLAVEWERTVCAAVAVYTVVGDLPIELRSTIVPAGRPAMDQDGAGRVSRSRQMRTRESAP